MTDVLNSVEPKDPSDSKIYTMDWSAELENGATISTSSWTLAPTGLTQDDAGIVTGSLKTSIKVSGGLPGTNYEATNTITTSAGETLNKTGIIPVLEQ